MVRRIAHCVAKWIAHSVARLVAWFRCVFKLVRLLDTPLWRVANAAVVQVMQHHELHKVCKNEERTSFCPRCGQMPDGDRRMEEARENFLAMWNGATPKRSELDFALAWAYFHHKI
jgi:hypothetical protein